MKKFFAIFDHIGLKLSSTSVDYLLPVRILQKMISLVSRKSSILLLILALNLLVCEAGRVRRADDNEEEASRKERLREKIEKNITEDKQQQMENEREIQLELQGILFLLAIFVTGVCCLGCLICRCFKKRR